MKLGTLTGGPMSPGPPGNPLSPLDPGTPGRPDTKTSVTCSLKSICTLWKFCSLVQKIIDKKCFGIYFCIEMYHVIYMVLQKEYCLLPFFTGPKQYL